MIKLKNNLIGQKFGKLTVIDVIDKQNGHLYCLCQCECGNHKTVRDDHLKSGNTISCGCARKDRVYNRIKDLTGQKFGKLTVLSYAFSDKHRVSHYLCECECGNQKIISGQNLSKGLTKSCGCIKKSKKSNDKPQKRDRFKWASYDRIYRIWYGIKYRCYYKTSTSYKKYGAKGVTMCEEWKNDFQNFKQWALENNYAENLTIDRIDNSKGYQPDNCRFVDYQTQNNNRSCNHYITIDNVTHTITEWLRIYNLRRSSYDKRIKKGYSEIEAITTPKKA